MQQRVGQWVWRRGHTEGVAKSVVEGGGGWQRGGGHRSCERWFWQRMRP